MHRCILKEMLIRFVGIDEIVLHKVVLVFLNPFGFIGMFRIIVEFPHIRGVPFVSTNFYSLQALNCFAPDLLPCICS